MASALDDSINQVGYFVPNQSILSINKVISIFVCKERYESAKQIG